MTSNLIPVEVLLLTGGKSTRMGTPKTGIIWEGSPLWLHIARKCLEFAEKVSIIGFRKEEYSMAEEESKFSFIYDDLQVGPLGGLMLGLENARTRYCLLIGCDMPFISSEAADELTGFTDNFDVVIPRHQDGLHPLFALYSKACLPAIHAALANKKRKVISFFPQVRVHEFITDNSSLDWNKVLFNINYPVDISSALLLNRNNPAVSSQHPVENHFKPSYCISQP